MIAHCGGDDMTWLEFVLAMGGIFVGFGVFCAIFSWAVSKFG